MRKYLFMLVLAMSSPALAQSNDEKVATRQLLEKYFSAYARPLTKAQQGELLNRVAWERPGWELLGKKTGNNCPMPSGTPISCDFLVYGPTSRGWDVIGNEGSSDSRITGPTGAGSDLREAVANGSRTVEDPVRPANAPELDPLPPPVFDPTPFVQRLDELQLKLAALSGQLAIALEQIRKLQGQVDDATTLHADLEDLMRRVQRLAEAQSRQPTKCVVSLFGLRLGCRLE